MEAVIQNEDNPLYIANPVYFPSTESANLTVPEGPAEGIAFAGMADKEGQGEHKGEESDWPNEETQHRHHLHSRRLDHHAHPVHEVRRLAWNDWYTHFNHTRYDTKNSTS